MRKQILLYKLVWGILLFSLIIPIKPPVSFAQAKLCCKKFCPHHQKKPAKLKCHDSEKEHKHSKNGPIQCCQNHCTKTFLREEAKSLLVLNSESQISYSKNKNGFAAYDKTSLLRPNNPNSQTTKFFNKFLQSTHPPLYLIHSSLLF